MAKTANKSLEQRRRRVARNPACIESRLSECQMQPGLSHAATIAGGDDSFGAMHGCAGQSGDEIAVSEIPDGGGFRESAEGELERDIQSTGFYRNKAKSIRAMASSLVKDHGGKVPETMEELTSLAGVGRKTANVVLGNAFGKNVGVVVDTHVARLSQRLELTKHSAAEKIELDLMALVPREGLDALVASD